MGILILIIIFLAIITISSLVNITWNKNAKEKINTVKKERIFWRLVNGYDGLIFDINAIFTIYLDQRHLVNFITGAKSHTKEDADILKLVKQKKDNDNIHNINDAIEKSDNDIRKIISKNQITFTNDDVKKFFKKHEEEQIVVPEQYERFVSFFLQMLRDYNIVISDIWEARKKLEEKSAELEWKTEERRVDAETLFNLKKSEQEVGEVVCKLIRVALDNNEVVDSLRVEMERWEKLHMLRWCIVDYSFNWIGTNGLQRLMWGMLANFAS